MANQDSSFYTNQEGAETIWQEEGNPFFVVRNGEMRINYEDRVLRYTSDLMEAGIDTDQKLIDLMDSEVIEFINNSWFEVWNSNDTGYYSEVIDELSEAIKQAKELNNA